MLRVMKNSNVGNQAPKAPARQRVASDVGFEGGASGAKTAQEKKSVLGAASAAAAGAASPRRARRSGERVAAVPGKRNRQEPATKAGKTSLAMTAPIGQPETGCASQDSPAETFDPARHHEEIAQVAYFLWEERGRPDGSQEDDWFRAEAVVRRRHIARS